MTADGTLSALAWTHVAVTYDGSSESNDPNFYINGSPIALSDDGNGEGTIGDDSDGNLFIGGISATPDFSFDGKVQDTRIYNRILSATEVAELYNSRCQRSVLNGLIFWAKMDGAKGLSRFDGVTLGVANTIVDEIGWAIGVPSGNPVGRGNTIQRIY